MPKKDSEFKTRKILTGMHRKYSGGIGKIPSEFLPSGQMKIVRRDRAKPKPVSEYEKKLDFEIQQLAYEYERLNGKLVFYGKLSKEESNRRRVIKIKLVKLLEKYAEFNPQRAQSLRDIILPRKAGE